MPLTVEAKDAFDAIDVQPTTDDTGKPLQKPTAPALDEIGKLALDLIPAAPTAATAPQGPTLLERLRGMVSQPGAGHEIVPELGEVPEPPPPQDIRQQALDQTKTDALGVSAQPTPVPPIPVGEPKPVPHLGTDLPVESGGPLQQPILNRIRPSGYRTLGVAGSTAATPSTTPTIGPRPPGGTPLRPLTPESVATAQIQREAGEGVTPALRTDIGTLQAEADTIRTEQAGLHQEYAKLKAQQKTLDRTSPEAVQGFNAALTALRDKQDDIILRVEAMYAKEKALQNRILKPSGKEAYIDLVNPDDRGVRELERFGKSIVGGAIGTAQTAARFTDYYANSPVAQQLANDLAEWKSKFTPDDPNALQQIADGVGSTLMFFVPGTAIGMGAAATQTAARLLAQRVVTMAVQTGKAENILAGINIGNRIVGGGKALSSWTAATSAAFLEAMAEAGAVFEESLQKGNTRAEAEKAANRTFWANPAVITITNKLGLFSETGRKTWRMVKDSFFEGVQEAAQEITSATAQGQQVDPKQVGAAFGIGAVSAGGISAVRQQSRNIEAMTLRAGRAGRILPSKGPAPVEPEVQPIPPPTAPAAAAPPEAPPQVPPTAPTVPQVQPEVPTATPQPPAAPAPTAAPVAQPEPKPAPVTEPPSLDAQDQRVLENLNKPTAAPSVPANLPTPTQAEVAVPPTELVKVSETPKTAPETPESGVTPRKENLKRRILDLMPPGTVEIANTLAEKLKATRQEIDAALMDLRDERGNPLMAYSPKVGVATRLTKEPMKIIEPATPERVKQVRDYIEKHGPTNLYKLAEELKVSSETINEAVEQLAGDGYKIVRYAVGGRDPGLNPMVEGPEAIAPLKGPKVEVPEDIQAAIDEIPPVEGEKPVPTDLAAEAAKGEVTRPWPGVVPATGTPETTARVPVPEGEAELTEPPAPTKLSPKRNPKMPQAEQKAAPAEKPETELTTKSKGEFPADTAAAGEGKSFKVAMYVTGEKRPAYNGLRFATKEDATAWADDLLDRWIQAERFDIEESTDAPTHVWNAEERRADRVESPLTTPEQTPTLKQEETRGERPGSTPEPTAAAPEQPAPRGSDQAPEAVPPETRPTPEKPGPGETRPVREGTGAAGERAPRPAPEKRPESDRGGRTGERSPVSEGREGEPTVAEPAEKPAEPEKPPKHSPTVSAPDKPSAPEIILGPDEKVGGTTEKTRYDANVRAITLVKELDRAGRMATPEEQRVLIQYSGWGSLKAVFDRRFEGDRQMQESRRSDYARYNKLKELLTPEEWETARQSSVNAHFTSPEVARAMWAALEHLGIANVPGTLRVMETGMGTGIFFATQPPALAAKSARVGVEMDKLTGRIAQHLFQASKVYIQPLEATPLPENFFSLNVGNYPFFEVGVFDPQFKNQPFLTANVHNYFFARNILALEEGGIIAVVTSRYTMDGAGQMATRFREWMEERGDLLGAIRLPETAFQENAGTPVVTDIVFFRKRSGTDEKGPESWVSTSQAYDEQGREIIQKATSWKEKDEPVFVNDYFLRHPEMILGKPAMTGTMQRQGGYTVQADGRDLGEAIKQAVAKLPENAFRIKSDRQKRRELIESEAIPAPGELLQGSYTVKDGKVYRKAGDQLVRQDVPIGQVAPTRALVKLRDAWRQLIRDQQDPGVTGEDVEKARKALNAAYTALVNEYGPLHGRKVKSFAFKDDPEFFNLLSVETWDADTQTAGKSDILVKRTQFPPEKIQAVETAKDALLVTLNEMNEVNWSRMAELTGRPVDELQTELDGLVYENPEGDWETADAYLSGNVRNKLRAAEAAAKLDPKYERNVDALKKVLPLDKEPKQIGVKVGSPWIPTRIYEDFLNYLADGALTGWRKATVTYTPLIAAWKVEVPRNVSNVGLEQTWGVTDRDGSTLFTADELIELYMNLKDPKVWRQDRSTDPPTRFVDHEMTLAAKAKSQKINDEFRKWLWEDPERAKEVQARFNEELNATVARKFDGSHLTLPGHAADYSFRKHQKDGIWRGMQSANVLYAHDVGTGKTAIIAALAMELKRIGRAKKSMIVIPNNALGRFPSMVASIYPSARILVGTADDLSAAKRQEFMGKIASGDWDTVIVAHSSFELLDIDPQRKIDFIQDAIRQYEDYLMGLGQGAPNTRDLIRIINGLRTKLQKLLSNQKKDPGLRFEQLGIDALFVDESHEYANLLINTRMTNTKGVPSGTDADKSMDLFLKTRIVYEKTGGKNVFFFTGSPIRNTIAEVFNLSAYLQPDTLKAMQLAFFDAWASTFGLRTTNMEFTAAGTAQLVERFSKFQNMPALRQMQEETMDYFPASEMPESAGIPKLKGGQAEVVSVESSPEHKRYLQHLAERIKRIKARKGPPQPGDDIILTVNNDGRHVALDIRTRIPNAPDHPDSKVNVAVQNIYDIWKETKKDRATQIVLCDIAVPQERGAKKAAAGPAAVPHFDVYKDMIDKLVKKGIPRDEIDYTQRVKGNREKLEAEIFSKLRSGKLRVVFGHSKQLGISANVHDRLIAEHNIDVPYTADTMIQRYGRIVRQGNMHPEVQIINYVTKESFDAVMWGYVRNKAKNMSDYFAGRIGDGEFEDVGETRLNAEQIMAIATGRPELMEHVAVQGKIRGLQSEKADWDRSQQRIAYEIATLPGQLDAMRYELKLAQVDGEKAKALLDRPKELWEINLDGTPYTDRETAGKRILELAEKYRSEWVGGALLGEYGGLNIELRKPTIGEMGQALQTHVLYPYIGGVTHERFNTHEYKSIIDKQTGNPTLQLQPLSPQGVMASLDAAVKRLRGRPDVLKEQAEKLEKTLAGYKKQGYGGEWPQQKDLDAAMAREAELATILQTNADQGVVDNVVPGDVSDAKDEDAASTDKDTPQTPEEPEEGEGGVTLGSGLGALQSIFERRRRMAEHRSPDPRVEAVLSGKARRGGLGRLAEAVQGYADAYAEEFVFGWAVRKWPQLRNDFRLAKDFHLDARRMAAEELVPILKDLTLPEFDTFSRLVYVRDLVESASRGEALPSPDPLNGLEPLTLEEVQAEKARLETVQTPAVEAAIARHDALMHEHAEELVFRGELREDQARQNYMPHHVLDYTDRIDIPGLPRKLQKQWRSYTKKREGSERLIDMDYLKVMWTHLNKYHLHNLIDDFTLEKLQEYDATAEIRTELERRLTAQNHPQAEMIAAQWRPSPGERQQVGKQVYEGVQFQRGAPFHWTATVPNGFVDQLVTESVNDSGRVGDVLLEGDETVESQVGRALARGRNYRTYMIPVELAAAMRQFREPYHVNVFVQSARAAQNVWKRVTLGAAGLPYEYANFLGDLENIMYEDARVGALPFFTMVGGAVAGAAMIPALGLFGAGAVGMTAGWTGAILSNRHMRRAFMASARKAFEKEIRDPRIKRWLAEAEKQRVSQSGIYGSDIGSLLRLHPELRRFLPAMQRAWQSRANPRNLLQLLEEVRESTPRLAKFFADMERIDAGQPVRLSGVKSEGLTQIALAGKGAREGPGDYGAVTQRYNNLFRGGLTPFSTWYHKMYWKFYERFRNKPGRMAAKILLPLMAMWVWNNTYGEEQEKRLPYWFRIMPHINTMYQTEDGKDIIVTFQSSAAAAFRFIGLDLAPHLAGQVARGEKEPGEATVELLKNMGLAPAKETVRMLSPLIKAIPGFFGLVEGRGRTVDIPSRRFVPKSLEGSDEGRERAASYLLETFLSPYAQYLRGDRSDQLPEVRDPIIRTMLLGFADVPRATGYRIYDPYRSAEIEAWSRREDWTAEYAEAIEQGDFDKQQELLAESQRLGMKPSKAAIQDTLRSRILFHRNEQRRKDERSALNP